VDDEHDPGGRPCGAVHVTSVRPRAGSDTASTALATAAVSRRRRGCGARRASSAAGRSDVSPSRCQDARDGERP
jgi:hypothetical protein